MERKRRVPNLSNRLFVLAINDCKRDRARVIGDITVTVSSTRTRPGPGPAVNHSPQKIIPAVKHIAIECKRDYDIKVDETNEIIHKSESISVDISNNINSGDCSNNDNAVIVSPTKLLTPSSPDLSFISPVTATPQHFSAAVKVQISKSDSDLLVTPNKTNSKNRNSPQKKLKSWASMVELEEEGSDNNITALSENNHPENIYFPEKHNTVDKNRESSLKTTKSDIPTMSNKNRSDMIYSNKTSRGRYNDEDDRNDDSSDDDGDNNDSRNRDNTSIASPDCKSAKKVHDKKTFGANNNKFNRYDDSDDNEDSDDDDDYKVFGSKNKKRRINQQDKRDHHRHQNMNEDNDDSINYKVGNKSDPLNNSFKRRRCDNIKLTNNSNIKNYNNGDNSNNTASATTTTTTASNVNNDDNKNSNNNNSNNNNDNKFAVSRISNSSKRENKRYSNSNCDNSHIISTHGNTNDNDDDDAHDVVNDDNDDDDDTNYSNVNLSINLYNKDKHNPDNITITHRVRKNSNVDIVANISKLTGDSTYHSRNHSRNTTRKSLDHITRSKSQSRTRKSLDNIDKLPSYYRNDINSTSCCGNEKDNNKKTSRWGPVVSPTQFRQPSSTFTNPSSSLSSSTLSLASPKEFVSPNFARHNKFSKVKLFLREFERILVENNLKVSYRSVVPFIDSHCHIDLMSKRIEGFTNYTNFMDENKDTYPSNYQGCVSVFCYPNDWFAEGFKENILDPLLSMKNVWATIGCHPKDVSSFDHDKKLRMYRLLRDDRVVAVGEMGLDYSQPCFKNNRYNQMRVFKELVDIAIVTRRPMVIHSRDAEEDTIDVLRKTCEQNLNIHRHCFTGTYEEACNWLRLFPKSYIGFTPAVTNFNKYPSLVDVIRHVPLNRILIETDAPYFVPRMMSRNSMQMSHPGMAITVAKEIAKLKQCSLDVVLQEVHKNTMDMYNIKPI